jgi:uroporphyrin-III C-methyltransferase / precorrin-2 dehydrogenase / sirohydrochlorin ferrochelatase
VVRLKGGDPFVFGRGGEEALALVAAGIPFEVVPGVSSAIAAAELAGIPVTHRGVSAAFVVVSGHAPAGYEQVLTTLAPQSATVVVLMGLASAGNIAAMLAAHGWKPATPAAIIRGAATEGAELWTGTLAELATAVEQSDSDRPGTIVIGDVVRVGAMLADFNKSSEREDEDDSGLTAVAR